MSCEADEGKDGNFENIADDKNVFLVQFLLFLKVTVTFLSDCHLVFILFSASLGYNADRRTQKIIFLADLILKITYIRKVH